MRLQCVIVFLLACRGSIPEAPAERTPASDALHLAIWGGDHAEVERLLASGADVDALDRQKLPAWFWATQTSDPRMLDLVLPRSRGLGNHKQAATILAVAVSDNNVALARRLLAGGAPIESRTKHGSALIVAAANARPAMVELLLAHGAKPDATDEHGETAAVAALRSGCTECLAHLRDRGAVIPAIVPSAPPAQASAPGAPPELRVAIERAVAIVMREGAHWVDEPGCASCHHQPVALRLAALAGQKGITVDRAHLTKVREMLANDNRDFAALARTALTSERELLIRSMDNSGDPAFGNAWFLDAMNEAGWPRTETEEIAAAMLARQQQPDGRWRRGPKRGLVQHSDLATTALAARAIDAYAPRADAADTARRIERARRWLLAARPSTTLEHVYHLHGLRWTRADGAAIAAAATALKARQLADGSWSEHGTAGDAFTTAAALLALHRTAAMPTSDPVYQRGLQHLRNTQLADGTWFVATRAAPLQGYFDSGFPHGKHQFASIAGTGWAALVLLHAL